MEKISGIIISSNKYKDNDAIINILTSEEIVPVIVRGAYKTNSKYLSFSKCFIEGEFEVYKGPTKYFKLKDCKIFIDYNSFFDDYDSLICVQLIKEILSKTSSDDYIKNSYLLLKITLQNIKEKGQATKYTLLFLAFLIRFIGYGLDCNLCKKCGSDKGLVALSFESGGLICQECLDEQKDFILSQKQIVFLTALFNEKYKSADSIVDISNDEAKILIKLLCDFISYFNDTKIISKDLLS